jgi:two-component system cell cycle response regulator
MDPGAMRILVADDDPTSCLIARAAVRRLGHDCDTVTDGIQAWDAFQAGGLDVIISDWVMPGLTGPELCRRLRADTRDGYTYVILVTSKGALDQIVEGMSAGADDYLVKPLDPDELEVRLISAARVTALHRQLGAHRTELQGLNLELAGLARRDPLTGAGNRRLLQEDLEVLEARVTRHGHAYCMALLDIDHFKAYNDTYGHQAGDHILRAVSAELKDQARGGDTLYRYGGEEFLCILPAQNLASGIVAAERMRRSVEALHIPHEGNPGGVVTVSAGVAMLDPGRIRPAAEVLRGADEALYQAKRLGRNRVEHLIRQAQPSEGRA